MPKTNEIFELQNLLQDYILNFDPKICEHIVSTEKVNAKTRLNLYADSYRLRIEEALQESYPVLHTLLGDEQFTTLARSYLDQNPSKVRSIRYFGDHLSTFLQTKAEYAAQPILSEVAKFEWLLMTVFDGPNAAVTGESALAALQPEAWPSLCFKFQPTMHFTQLDWNTVAIWKAIDADEDPPSPEKGCEEATWLIWRRDLRTLFRSLDSPEAWALLTAQTAHNFEAICEGLCEWYPEEEVATQAALLLKRWLVDGLIVEISHL